MRRYGVFLCVIGATIGIALLLREGYYPVAWVGGNLLSARDFSEQFQAAKHYYSNFARIYGSSSTIPATNLEGTVLQSLIEASLIHAEVKKEMGREVEGLVADKVGVFKGDKELAQAAEAIYGVGTKDFERMVLVPQAEREILAGRLLLRGEEFPKWLDKAKRESRIIVLVPGFKWTGEEVKKETP